MPFFVEPVVHDGGERDEVLWLAVEGLQRALVESGLGDFFHDPLPLAKVDELALFGRRGSNTFHGKNPI